MFPLPLALSPRPSRRLRVIVAGLHLLALYALWLADLPAAAHAGGAALLLASLGLALRPQPALDLRCGRRGDLAVRRGETWQPAAECEVPLLLPGLTLLRYRVAAGRRRETRAILADSLPAEDFRRLRVWLKWRLRQPQAATPDPAGALRDASGSPPRDTH